MSFDPEVLIKINLGNPPGTDHTKRDPHPPLHAMNYHTGFKFSLARQVAKLPCSIGAKMTTICSGSKTPNSCTSLATERQIMLSDPRPKKLLKSREQDSPPKQNAQTP